MKTSRFKPEQIVRILREAETSGNTIPEVCRKHGISDVTFYRWRKQYQGLSTREAKRLKALQDENQRLKKLVAEQALALDKLQEIVEKNCKPGRADRGDRSSQTGWALRAAQLCAVRDQPIQPVLSAVCPR
jgi:putative transposase